MLDYTDFIRDFKSEIRSGCFPENATHRLRGTPNGSTSSTTIDLVRFRNQGVDVDAIAAGLQSVGALIEITIPGNAQTDSQIASLMDRRNKFEISKDCGSNWHSCSVEAPIGNDGWRWVFILRLQ